MSRYQYGAGIADYVIASSDGIWTVSAGAQVTFWDQQVEGIQYTDLLDVDGNPVSYVLSDEMGQIPRFQGPDGVAGMWADAGGGRRAWMYAHIGGQGTPGNPGSRWFFGETSPDEATLSPAPVPGDLYLDQTDGDLYSYDGAVWVLRSNIRGPQGPAGGGAVESVNGQTGAVVLTAANVGAIPATEKGQPSGVASLDATGKVPAEQIAADLVQSVNGQTGNVVLAAADVGALATSARGAASGVASLGADSKVPTAQLPPIPAVPGIWLPSDYGLSGWAYDLHANSRTPGDMPAQAGRLYLVGVPLRAAKTVTQVAVHVMGYDKPNTTTTSAHFGIYDSAFAPLSRSGNLLSSLPEVHNVGGQIAKFTIPSVSLTAGYYYVAILIKASSTTSTPFLAATNWGSTATTSGAVGASTSGVQRWLQTSSTSLTSLPAAGALTTASFVESTTCYWAAIV